MGWALAAAEQLPETPTDNSITVALIAALGTVVVALLGLVAQWLSRSAKTTESTPDPRLGERVAVAETLVSESHRTIDVLDRYVDKIGDEVDRLRWEIDDMKAWRDEHRRSHGGTR